MYKNFFVCNTFFQLIAVINMVEHSRKSECNIVVLTDTTQGMFALENSIKSAAVFDEVICFERLKYIKSKKKFFQYVLSRENTLNAFLNDEINVFFYNFDLLIASIVDVNLKHDNNIMLHRFEEGYVSYYSGEIDSRALRYANFFKKIIQPDFDLMERIADYYFYEPDFVQFEANYKFKKISPIYKSDKKFKGILNCAFGISENDIEIKEKYIFFEEPFSLFPDNKINDVKLVKDIVDVVGKDNLIVKLHPRIMKNRFEEYGIHTYMEKRIPWELLQLNADYSDKVFLTVSSGCVIQGQMLFGEGNPTFLLYECVEEYPSLVTEQYKKHIKNIVRKFNGNYMVPTSRKDFLEKLREMDLFK